MLRELANISLFFIVVLDLFAITLLLYIFGNYNLKFSLGTELLLLISIKLVEALIESRFYTEVSKSY